MSEYKNLDSVLSKTSNNSQDQDIDSDDLNSQKNVMKIRDIKMIH